MILLLVLAALMALLTVWFLSRSLHTPPLAVTEQGDALIQLRDRLLAQLREIDVEAGDRNVDPAVAADERAHLEAELAQVLRELDATNVRAGASEPSISSRRMLLPAAIALVVILPLASAGLYFVKNAATLAQLEQVQSIAGGEIPPMVLEMVARLERRLAEQPGDPRGWAQLGRAYAVLGREREARAAYVRAYELAPKDKEIMGAYAAFLMSIDPAQPPAEAIAIFKKLHALDPLHPGALWALGLVAYHEQKFGQAVKYWEQLLKQLPPDSDVAPQVQQAVDMARSQKGQAK
jgi:cytochrome c-type biogenesis protein CcmH